MVDQINMRFRSELASTDGGVLMHPMDGFEDSLGDRISASLLRTGTRLAIEGGASDGFGMILNPHHLRVLCAYGGNSGARSASRAVTCASDGSSWVQRGRPCLPGCAPLYHDVAGGVEDPAWCTPSRTRDDWCDGLPWRPQDLDSMLRQEHATTNDLPLAAEIILDGPHFRRRQPSSVDAIFTISGSSDVAARTLHLGYLQAFPEVSFDAFPLLVYDPNERIAPFTVAASDDLGVRAAASEGTASSPARSSRGQPPPPPPPPLRAANTDGHRGSNDPCDPLNAGQFVNLACRGYGR